MAEDRVSVVLPVHAGTRHEELGGALASLASQSRRPDQLVLVLDGPVGNELRALVDDWAAGSWVTLVELPQNRGQGVANQAGLQHASCPWVLKADADDLSEPSRLEDLLQAAESRSLDVVGSSMWEFDTDPAAPRRVRRVPLTHDEIRRRMRWNNPMNHPTVLYRRDLALAAGGYPPWRSMEDYALFIRLMVSGARFGNIDRPTVRFRADRDMRRRRSGLRVHAAYERAIRRELLALPRTGPISSAAVLGLRLVARAAPPGVIGATSNALLTRRPR